MKPGKPYKQARRLLTRDGGYGNRYYYHDAFIGVNVAFPKTFSKSKCIALLAYELQNPI